MIGDENRPRRGPLFEIKWTSKDRSLRITFGVSMVLVILLIAGGKVGGGAVLGAIKGLLHLAW